MKIAQFLIENGANINDSEDWGKSPLHLGARLKFFFGNCFNSCFFKASANGNLEMVQYLIENGADISQTSIFDVVKGWTPLHYGEI